MRVDAIAPDAMVQAKNGLAMPARLDESDPGSFGGMLKRMVNETNDLHKQAGAQIKSYVAGDDVDLHDVMIAAEKASVSFEMVMEVRNKILDAYNQLMRMQV